MKTLPQYTDQLIKLSSAVKMTARTIAEQSGLPVARVERIFDGGALTDKEHRAICRALPRMKHYQQLLLEFRAAPVPAEPAEKKRRRTVRAESDTSAAARSSADEVDAVTVVAAPKPDLKKLSPTPTGIQLAQPASSIKLDTKGVIGMYTKLEEIDPDTAKFYLGANVINREIKSKHVEFLANEMLEGRWVESHQGIAFDRESRLLDGQHRLHAIIYSGKTVKINVTYNADPQSFFVIDTGNSSRSLTDVWSIADKTGNGLGVDVSQKAEGGKSRIISALRTLHYLIRGRQATRWSTTDLQEHLRAFPEVTDALRLINCARPALGRAGFLAGISFAQPVEDQEFIRDFIKRVTTKVNMDAGHAAFVRAYENFAERSGKHGQADTNLALAVVTIRALWSRKKDRVAGRLYVKDVKDVNVGNDDAYIYYRTLRAKKGLTVA
ncbi:MAG TPA: hypothetical protein VGS96_09815 [Thermoanaerobaculia bacterium]|jgi:hypothetical protein|nr:hypothetical protein [Thermoanaerobaculia bacterium]